MLNADRGRPCARSPSSAAGTGLRRPSRWPASRSRSPRPHARRRVSEGDRRRVLATAWEAGIHRSSSRFDGAAPSLARAVATGERRGRVLAVGRPSTHRAVSQCCSGRDSNPQGLATVTATAWVRRDCAPESNRQPPKSQFGALPIELTQHVGRQNPFSRNACRPRAARRRTAGHDGRVCDGDPAATAARFKERPGPESLDFARAQTAA